MKKEDPIKKYCLYYDGKDKPPVDADYDTFARFWYLEKEYFEGAYYTRREYWETGLGMKMCVTDSPDIREFFDKNNFSKTIRGFLAHVVITAMEMCPMGGYNFIFNYGKK